MAGAVLFLLSDLAAYVTGQALVGRRWCRRSAPRYLGPDDLPVFVRDDALRARCSAPRAERLSGEGGAGRPRADRHEDHAGVAGGEAVLGAAAAARPSRGAQH